MHFSGKITRKPEFEKGDLWAGEQAEWRGCGALVVIFMIAILIFSVGFIAGISYQEDKMNQNYVPYSEE